MIALRDKETGAELGTITEEQLRVLVDNLEEEFEEDRDYYITSTTLDIMQGTVEDSEFIALLRRAIGERDGVEIEWVRTD